MDTKTPPIPQKQHLDKTKFKTPPSRAVQVSLPPLTPPPNRRQRLKTPSSPWARSSAPGIYAPSETGYNYQTEHPYRVLHLGATPLMHACQQADRSRVLRLLKEQKETIGYRDRTLRTALHYCMDAGTGGAVAAAAPELVNAADAEGHTPLHLAVIAGDAQLVAVLLANGAEVNAKDLEGHSVLHWATVCGEVECVRLVLAAGARPSTPDMRGGSPLHYAAQCCGAAAPTELAVPKKVGLKVLQLLLDYGANCNAKDEDGRQPILWAASAGSVEAVLALARAGGSVAAGASDKDGLTALHCAASRGHAGCVEALINLCGSEPDHVDDNGCSALHYAATLGHADATALLLRLGADPNRQDRKGRTPALCAAAKGQLETLKLLAQHGGSLYARTVRGSGIGHESAASGRIELIKWLAKKRPTILDVATHDGRTPLHVAALHGHVDACKVLLDNGARVNAILRTTKGSQMTALDAALYRGHRDCAKLIQMHGGTTAQHIRSRKQGLHKEFAAKLRAKRTETSSDTDATPRRRRRRRGSRGSDLYFEERWEERRTRRRGSLRRSDRTGSRSYSEEEPRSVTERETRSHGRRARSESARYEHAGRGRRKKNAKKKSGSRRHNYESSSDTETSDYSDEDSDRARTSGKRSQERGNDVEKMREPDSDEVSDGETATVSDDSLEVVIVKKSVEKTSERVQMSGRKPKRTPRGKKNTVVMSTKSKTKRKIFKKNPKDSVAAISDAEGRAKEEINVGKLDYEEPKASKFCKMELKEENEDIKQRKIQYQIETGDSTSQEAVERVTVTVMVHKDHHAETPKTTTVDNSSRNGRAEANENPEKAPSHSSETTEENRDEGDDRDREIESRKKTRPRSARPNSSRSRVSSARTRMDHILEKADEMQSALVQKAADLKKGIEEMREQISGEKLDTNEELPENITESLNVTKENRPENAGESYDGESSDVVQQGVISGIVEESDTEIEGNAGEDGLGERKTGSESRSERSTVSRTDRRSSGEKLERNKSRESSSSIDGDEKDSSKSKKSSLVDESAVQMKESSKVSSADEEIINEVISGGNPPLGSLSNSKSRPGTADEKSGSPEEKTERKSSRSGSKISKTKSRESGKSGSSKSNSSKKSIADYEPPDKGTDSMETPKARKEETATDADVNNAELEEAENDPRSGEPTSEDVGDELMNDEEAPAIIKIEAGFHSCEESSSSRRTVSSTQKSQSRPLTARHRGRPSSSTPKSPTKRSRRGIESSEESSPTRPAIVAVIESPDWPEDEEEEEEEEDQDEANEEAKEQEEEAIDNEIRDAIGDYPDPDTDQEENSIGVLRVLPSTSDEETPRTLGFSRTSGIDSLPQVAPRLRPRVSGASSPGKDGRRDRPRTRNRRDSGGRDSGIEPSPRISKIPKRTLKCYPNTEKQQALHMETVTRDVQISLRRYHLERKIFFQLMELKRLQIRHGRANEQVLVKRQVEAFHKAGTTGPTLGVAKYDQPLTFRHFELFLYEQLRRLQRRPATPDWCTGAKQCTQKTHRCHHATSAYTSLPIYTYLGVGDRAGSLLPNIEGRGRGQMTVEVTRGEDKQVIALPAEKLDRSKRYFVTFTVRGESQDKEKASNKNPKLGAQRNAKSV